MSDNQSSLDASGAGTGAAVVAAGTSTAGASAENGPSAGGAKAESQASRAAADTRPGRRRSDRIILASAATQRVVDQATAVARSNTPVVILGPDGSGRQHIARAIHAWSQRAGGPLVHLSGGGTAEGLQARELFGAGAAVNEGANAEGALGAAADGTLVVERADLLSESVRARLIRGLREGAFTKEGSSDAQPLTARLIVTAASGNETLLGDLAVQVLELPALADRKEDVLPLAAHFLAEFADEEGMTAVGFTVDARRWLVEEPWTGNVLELRERIRQAVGLSDSGSISAEALMLSTEGDEVPSFKEAKRAFETRYVEGLLRRCSGNISRAARLAKKDRKDFYDVIRRTGVDPTRFRS